MTKPKRSRGRQPGTKIIKNEKDRQVQFSSRLPRWLKEHLDKHPKPKTKILIEALTAWINNQNDKVRKQGE